MSRTRNRSRGGRVESSFSPTVIAGLQLWLDAADAATITQVANAVSQWSDKSGNANHVTQGTATNQPATNTATINSKNVISFDGTDNRMIIPAGLYSISSAANTLFMVLKSGNVADTRNILRGRITTDASEQWGMYFSGGTTLNARTGNVVAGKALGAGITVPLIATMRATTVVNTYVNGDTAATSGAITFSACDMITLGGYSATNNAQAYNGYIGEVIVYNTALSVADTNRVGNYLASKWGITWTNF